MRQLSKANGPGTIAPQGFHWKHASDLEAVMKKLVVLTRHDIHIYIYIYISHIVHCHETYEKLLGVYTLENVTDCMNGTGRSTIYMHAHVYLDIDLYLLNFVYNNSYTHIHAYIYIYFFIHT